MAEHLPLRIEWKLATPWCPPARGLHLDGLIAWALLQSFEREGCTPENFDEVLHDLPFAKCETGAGWVWKASFVTAEGLHGSERRYITAKTAVLEFAERMHDGRVEGKPLKDIDTMRGPYKNDAFWYTVEHADRCVAYCVGDPERITPLLDEVTHLGKRGRLDHGRIDPQQGMQARIEEDPMALEHWRRRHLPEPLPGYVPVVGRLHPPYWRGEGETAVWRPAG